MARIAGVDLPREKRVEIGLTYIYGIGRVSSNKILEKAQVESERERRNAYKAQVSPDTHCKDLTDDEVKRISDIIDETMTVEGDLRREIAMNIKRLQEIGCYRGIRHRKGLPVRGQKTKTNARTRKGPKKTIAQRLFLLHVLQVRVIDVKAFPLNGIYHPFLFKILIGALYSDHTYLRICGQRPYRRKHFSFFKLSRNDHFFYLPLYLFIDRQTAFCLNIYIHAFFPPANNFSPSGA